MTTTIALDDELVTKACLLTGLHEKTVLVREALKALIDRENERRVARLGSYLPGRMPRARRAAADLATDDFG